MKLLKLLLIEDDPADATTFIDSIQNKMGRDVEVEWRSKLGEAMALLESGVVFDQIWLDPNLRDLGQSNIGKALSTLKGYVPPGELRLISTGFVPNVNQAAQQHDVEVVRSGDSNHQILEIVQQLLVKRSSGMTTQVHHIEIEVAKIDARLEGLEKEFGKIATIAEELNQRYATVPYELNSIKEAIVKLSNDRKESKANRLNLILALISMISAVTVAVATNVIPKLLDKVELPFSAPVSPASSTPQPTQSSLIGLMGSGNTTWLGLPKTDRVLF